MAIESYRCPGCGFLWQEHTTNNHACLECGAEGEGFSDIIQERDRLAEENKLLRERIQKASEVEELFDYDDLDARDYVDTIWKILQPKEGDG